MQSTSNLTHQTSIFIKEPDSVNEVRLQFYILIFHNLNHHLCFQLKTAPEQQAVRNSLILTNTLHVLLKQLFRPSVMVARSFSSFLQISSRSFLYSL